jgi:hypothetical protein
MTASIKLQNIPSGIAIDETQNYFIELTSLQMQSFMQERDENNFRILYTKFYDSCAMSIYFNNVSHIQNVCRYEIISTSYLSTINNLYDTTFLFTNVSKYEVTCSQQKRIYLGCLYCTIDLPPLCTLSTQKQFILQTSLTENVQAIHFDPSLVNNITLTPFLNVIMPSNQSIVHIPQQDDILSQQKEFIQSHNTTIQILDELQNELRNLTNCIRDATQNITALQAFIHDITNKHEILRKHVDVLAQIALILITILYAIVAYFSIIFKQ